MGEVILFVEPPFQRNYASLCLWKVNLAKRHVTPLT